MNELSICPQGQGSGLGSFFVMMVIIVLYCSSNITNPVIGTVISIHENPFPHRKVPLNTLEKNSLDVIRRNSLNVFQQLSKANDAYISQNPTLALAIRTGIHPTMPGSVHSSSIAISDSPSLLFYYLFDDWYTSYSLVSKKEHQYGSQLEILVSHFIMLHFVY